MWQSHHFKYSTNYKCLRRPVQSDIQFSLIMKKHLYDQMKPSNITPVFCVSSSPQLRTNTDKNFKILKLASHSACRLPPAGSSFINTWHSWRLSYLSSPLLRILYFSRKSACFCRRISVCFLKPLTLGNSTEDTFRYSSSTKPKFTVSSQMCNQTKEKHKLL